MKVKVKGALLSPVDVFRQVQKGELKKFPKGFWTNPDAGEYAADITRDFFESILHWSIEDIKEKISQQIFLDNGLWGMVIIIYHCNIWQTVNAAYPGQCREWELQRVPPNFWTEETGKQAVKWLIEEKLKLSEVQINIRINKQVFVDHGLVGMLNKVYGGSVREAINTVYPNQFLARRRRLAENQALPPKEKMRWTEEVINEILTKDAFFDSELYWVLKIYDYSTWQAMDALNPGYKAKKKPKRFPINFWNEETGKRATKWLIEEKLKWTKDEIKEMISKKVFVDNGLVGMLNGIYNGSPWQAINAAYPGKFKEWELKTSPKNFWTEETRIQAIKWMIEEKLKWNEYEIKAYIRLQTFKDFGLYTVMRKSYSNNIFKAINDAYPGRFQKADFERGRPKSFLDLARD